MFPEIRVPAKTGELFDNPRAESEAIPDLLRVMDLQQEQLARSLGEGHRIIHGVAGSGKTLILGYRAFQLAQVCTKPILILCYNKSLATRLTSIVEEKGLREKVNVNNFHAWCFSQLRTYNVNPPKKEENDSFWDELVNKVIESIEKKQIPSGQYDAVLIDEGHDFRPEWLKLIVQMVDPHTNSLLVLYDDAQSIYEHEKTRKFSFKSVGIQAQGRTTILKINYRNTQEVLQVATAFARDLLTAREAEEDGVPLISPLSAGRHGERPQIIKLPSLKDEFTYIAEQLTDCNQNGIPWKDMAVIYRHYDPVGKEALTALRKLGIPVSWQKEMKFSNEQDTVKVITMHSSKGLEFPIVAIAGMGTMPQKGEAIEDEARLLYVAMTRATTRLIMTHHEESEFTQRITKSLTA